MLCLTTRRRMRDSDFEYRRSVQIDRERWDLEYQQVAPKLHIKVTAEARDWRTHLDTVLQQLSQAFQVVDGQEAKAQHGGSNQNSKLATVPEIKRTLKQMQTEVQEQLSKLDTRERFLNDEFATRTDVYRNKKELLQIKQACTCTCAGPCHDWLLMWSAYLKSPWSSYRILFRTRRKRWTMA